MSSLPRIFPGIVHERTRRGSVRQGSVSEKDFDSFSNMGSAIVRSGEEGPDGAMHGPVPEEATEDSWYG